jgi:hypothetical protein
MPSRSNYTGDDEIIQRNIERSMEVIEAKKNRNVDNDIPEDITRDLDTDARPNPPGQTNTPIGGESNANFNGGTADRKKRG